MQRPEYTGLRIGATVLLICAGIDYVCAAGFLVAGLIAMARGTSYVSGASGGVDYSSSVAGPSLSVFVPVLWFLMIGATMHAMSAACLALRDIARNSFSVK